MSLFVTTFASLLTLTLTANQHAGAHPDDQPSLSAPMVDASCSEYSRPGLVIHPGVTVFTYQDSGSVWVCIELPEGSYTTGEFKLQTLALKTPMILHVSAQLGEWFEGDIENQPKVATSELWWNNQGWIATPSRFNGTELVDGEPRPRFLRASAQEMQLSKKRFGTGEWKLSGSFWSVRLPSGKNGSVEIRTSRKPYLPIHAWRGHPDKD